VARKGEWHASAGWSLFAQLALDGECDIDDGETSCKTPDAVAYIEKSAKRKQARLIPAGMPG